MKSRNTHYFIFTTLVPLFCLCNNVYGSSSMLYSSVSRKQILDGYILSNHTMASHSACVLECLRHPSCNGSAYLEGITKTAINCYLIKSDNHKKTMLAGKWLYTEKVYKDKEDKYRQWLYGDCKAVDNATRYMCGDDVLASLNKWCEFNSKITKDNKSQKIHAVYGAGKTDSEAKWRCYREDNLDENKIYYKEGNSYKSYHQEMVSFILDHPFFDIKEYIMAGSYETCTQVCSKTGRKCSGQVKTLNSIWLFHYFGKMCPLRFGYREFYNLGSDPNFSHYNSKCYGYVFSPDPLNLKKFNCDAKGRDHLIRRLCRCI